MQRALSCCAWALTGDELDALGLLHEIGLRNIDVRPSALRSPEALQRLKDLELTVRCVAASHEMPEGAAFDSADESAVRTAMEHVQSAISHAADLGAAHAYIVPEAPVDGDSLARYTQLLPPLADHAAHVGVRLCVEHFPGTALPTVAASIGFLRHVGHDNLFLLLDIGHAQMSKEDPRAVLTAAAGSLGYVHLDDNDGVEDVHWALTDGVQSRASLVALLSTLDDIGYDGPMSIEMKDDLPDPADAIRRSYDLMRQLTDTK